VKQVDVALINSLLALGGNPNAPVGKKGMTAMDRAATAGNSHLEILLESGSGRAVDADTAVSETTTLPMHQRPAVQGAILRVVDSLDRLAASGRMAEDPDSVLP
jgi:hypothetical protein